MVATVEADGLSSDTTKKAKITLIDQNGEPMSEEYLQFFNISDDHYVNVSMKLWRVKDNVKIKANYSGTPAKGYLAFPGKYPIDLDTCMHVPNKTIPCLSIFYNRSG